MGVRLGAAVLCEAATVRENLLNILGGGITQIASSNYPAPFGSTLALLFYVDPFEVSKSYALEVSCYIEGTEESLWEWTGDMVSEEPMNDGVQSVSLPLNLSVMGLPEPGDYSLVVKANGETLGGLSFRATQFEPQAF